MERMAAGTTLKDAPTAKVLPPTMPPPIVARTALEALLDETRARRLAVVVAGAGFGKSTLLSAWAARSHVAWYTLSAEDSELASLARGVIGALRLRVPDLPPELSAAMEGARGPDADRDDVGRAQACAGLLCDALQQRLTRDLVLVFDDVHEIGAEGASPRLIEGLCRQAPPRLRLVLASRTEPPFPIDRLRGQGQVVEITGNELAFSVEEVESLFASTLGEDARPLAASLHDATGGWPVAVRLALEALRGVSPRERRRTLEALRRPGGPLFAYLAGEVFEREAPEIRELIRTVAPLERFTAELCADLGLDNAAQTLASLLKRGLFVEPDRTEVGWFSLSELVRDFALEEFPLEPGELSKLHRRVARWCKSHGHVEEALRSFAAVKDHPQLARLLVERGEAMLSAGRVETIIHATELVPPALRDSAVEKLAGQARQIHGDWEGALACFERASAGLDDLEPGIAWRMGLIHHLRGELDEALAVYERGRIDGTSPRDDALLLAWHASVAWLRSDVAGCREKVTQAFEIATRASDSQALAAAHTVLAMLAAIEGDRAANDAHYLRALEHAERAGDVLQIIRVRTNRGSRHMEEGAYEEALAELNLALRLADLAGFAFFRALALSNRGLVRFHLGRFEEAIADLESAKAIYQRMGSRDVSYPLGHLGEVYRERGDYAQARAAYEEAAALAAEAEDVQGLVPALAGLARVLAIEEPEEAERLASRAVDYGPGMAFVQALLAVGHVAFHRGDRDRAVDFAEQAGAAARARRDRAGLAESLELHALGSSDGTAEIPQVQEAVAIWRDIRNPVGEARAQLLLARLLGAREGRPLAERAERQLRALGARGYAASAAALLASFNQESQAPIVIQSLGQFRVLRDGEPIQLAEWQSKKARDALKILVARQGKPVPREAMMEALWPEGDPAKVANRLSVALSTLRSVLDRDKRFGADHFVRADKSAVSLELENVELDVARFLEIAVRGLELLREGRGEEATEYLGAAEAAYQGDFLEEDAYEDWATPLREQARDAYMRIARALAAAAVDSGDGDAATRYLLRVVEKDPHDEDAHLALVSTLAAGGHHGEARRSYRVYTARMQEIGVEAAPFPGPESR
jgi:ATP/maltotriose-dependent transcriptional regulator MalT/DNA-binding SARP family transcriptional activator